MSYRMGYSSSRSPPPPFFFLMTLWFNPSLFTIPRKTFQSPLDLWSDTSNLCFALACLAFVFFIALKHIPYSEPLDFMISVSYTVCHVNLTWIISFGFPIRLWECLHVNILILMLSVSNDCNTDFSICFDTGFFFLYVIVLLHTEYQVVINLHHEGVMISSRETKGGSCAVWNSSFLFDLPTGEISQLQVMLEFVIMQVKKLWGLSRSESISTCSYIVLTL